MKKYIHVFILVAIFLFAVAPAHAGWYGPAYWSGTSKAPLFPVFDFQAYDVGGDPSIFIGCTDGRTCYSAYSTRINFVLDGHGAFDPAYVISKKNVTTAQALHYDLANTGSYTVDLGTLQPNTHYTLCISMANDTASGIYGYYNIQCIGDITTGKLMNEYNMNSGVATAAAGLLTSLTAQIFRIIPIALSIVGGVIVTLFGLKWLMRFVRGNMHG